MIDTCERRQKISLYVIRTPTDEFKPKQSWFSVNNWEGGTVSDSWTIPLGSSDLGEQMRRTTEIRRLQDDDKTRTKPP